MNGPNVISVFAAERVALFQRWPRSSSLTCYPKSSALRAVRVADDFATTSTALLAKSAEAPRRPGGSVGWRRPRPRPPRIHRGAPYTIWVHTDETAEQRAFAACEIRS